MATCQITVFADSSALAIGSPIQELAVTIGAVSTQSAALTGSKQELRKVRIMCDTNAWVEWGDNPTATTDGTSGRMFGAENPEYVGIRSGQIIAVIAR